MKNYNRLRFWIHIENGSVINFIVQFETFVNSEWHPVVRYDLAHNFFHRDVMNYKGNKEKYAITIDNLKDALNYSEQDLKDRWEFYRNQFFKKKKGRK